MPMICTGMQLPKISSGQTNPVLTEAEQRSPVLRSATESREMQASISMPNNFRSLDSIEIVCECKRVLARH